MGLISATSVNVANMVGIGPFITIPMFVGAMGGPQALVGWIAAAVLVLCDGLVWSELGAALPGSGGTYHFLRTIFGHTRWGRLLAFLFIWQFAISGTMEMASGYLGAKAYVGYVFPGLEPQLVAWGVPGGFSLLAALAAIGVSVLLCRRIRSVAWLSTVLCAGSLVTILVVIAAGLRNFDARLLALPPDAFRLDPSFARGLGGAMLIAVYDYLGYYNVCHLGEEVHEPARTIPRAVILSVILVATLYLTMNTCIMAVVPWQEVVSSPAIAAEFMERLYGRPAAVALTWLVLWTVAACVFALLLGYSRIPLAAARNGDFFPVFGRLHARDNYPYVSILCLGGLTAAFCFLPLDTVIAAAVTVRILVQFVAQIVALHVLRTRQPEFPLPFRMWLYPVPSLVALVGWLYVLGTAKPAVIALAVAVAVSGCIAFWLRALWQLDSRALATVKSSGADGEADGDISTGAITEPSGGH